MKGCNCRARTCYECGYRMGCRVRERLASTAARGDWIRPAILTLTIDRKQFDSPRAAWLHVTDRRYVSRLLRLLGVKLWVWVLEFQQKTGDGWPHWHVMIDLGRCPKGRLDFKRAWALWRDRWKLGGLDVSARARKFSNALHAIHYITKYLMKQPEGGYPEWVLEAHGIRFVQGCRQLPPLVADVTAPAPPAVGVDAGKAYKPRRSLLDRTVDCGLACKIFGRQLDPTTGEISTAWLGDLPCCSHDLVELSQTGRLPGYDFRYAFDPDTHRPSIISAHDLTAGDVNRLRRLLLETTPAIDLQTQRRETRRELTWINNAYRKRKVDHPSPETT